MSERKNWLHALLRPLRLIAVFLAFSAGVVVMLLWLAGKFERKVSDVAPAAPMRSVPSGELAEVRLVKVPVTETAVGTVRAVHEATIGSKLLARVLEVNMKAGQQVATGDVLVRLDDSDLRPKLQQAQAAVRAAEAANELAIADEKRYAALVKTHAISQQEYEKAQTHRRGTEADLRRLAETVNELEATLAWATVRSPLTGTVIDKKVEVGDLVSPGQPLATLFDPTRMQLVANVRESLALNLHVGQLLPVQIEGLGKRCQGAISEIVPQAQSASRAFQVKVTGPCPTGIYSGMFGRIYIPLDEEQVLAIPSTAVRRVGQLELVDVVTGDRVERRAIRTGRAMGDDVEVLSGLRAGERVVRASAGEMHHE